MSDEKADELKALIQKIESGEGKIAQIGSVVVGSGADPYGAATAVRISIQATEIAQRGMELWRQGHLEAASTCLVQSLVLEDAIGNLSGISSDLGNLGAIYNDMKIAGKAAAAYRKALQIDAQLLRELPDRADRVGQGPDQVALEHREYKLMEGLHLEGLARSQILRNEFAEARDLVSKALVAYEEAGAERQRAPAQELQTWLLKRL